MPTGDRALCASRLLLSALVMCLACGPVERKPAPTAYAPRPRPGAIIDQHPECADASEIGPLVALRCREGCVPRVRPQVVCVDDPPGGLLGLGVGETIPVFAAVWDSLGECQGYRIVRLRGCATFDNVAYSWAKHPKPGEWCSRDTEIAPDWGYFERDGGGKNRLFCGHDEFFPNE